MSERFTGWLRAVVGKATKEDLKAVEATKNVKFIHPNTGMTDEEFLDAFGSFDVNTVSELLVLAGKRRPRNPEEWKALAEDSKRRAAEFLSKK